jgi:hypothetical protein
VHRAVDFDREVSGVTVEVEDVGADGMLTPEVQPFKAMRPKGSPQEALRQGHFLAEAPGASPR